MSKIAARALSVSSVAKVAAPAPAPVPAKRGRPAKNVATIPSSVYAGPRLSADTVVRVPLAQLHIQSGYNVAGRTFNPAKDASDMQFLLSVQANGVTTPITAMIDDTGRAVIRAGHRRYAACQTLNANKVPGFDTIPVLLFTGSHGSAGDLLISNMAKTLSMLQNSEIALAMVKEGKGVDDIAKIMGYTDVKMVQGLLETARLPAAILKLIRSGTISASLAIEIVRSKGAEGAVTLFAKAVSLHKDKRITRQHLLEIDPTLPSKGNVKGGPRKVTSTDGTGKTVTVPLLLKVDPAGDGSADIVTIDGDHVVTSWDTVADAEHFLVAVNSVFTTSPMFAKLALAKAQAAAAGKGKKGAARAAA